MPEQNSVATNSTSQSETSHEFSILMQRVLNADNSPDFTSEQIDELLAQKRQVNEFVHEDKKRESENSKFFLTVVLLFILIFSAMIVWKLPEYFGEVLSFLAGLFGGTLGGYGWSSRNK